MSVAVIDQPAVMVSVAEARVSGAFAANDDDATISMLLSAAQGTIDGPDGNLGRSIGLQTLELFYPALTLAEVRDSRCLSALRSYRLPYGPVREVVSVTVGNPATTLDSSAYSFADGALTFTDPPSWLYPVRVRYKAGYGQVGSGNLQLPVPIKQAIVMMAAQLRRSTMPTGLVSREEVTDVGATSFSSPSQMDGLINSRIEDMLAGYRVYWFE